LSESVSQWPTGLSEEVAVIGASIAYIENKLGILFIKGLDDLDWYEYYIFRFKRGNCALMRYDHAQVDGVTLVIEQDHLENLDDSLSYFLKELRLNDCPILWRRAELE
jgi:hypothetical protein